MGKKRVITESKEVNASVLSTKEPTVKQFKRKQFPIGILHIHSTYNNTKVLLADQNGNTLAWSSSGALGFKGAKKGTPFAASKVGDLLADKAIETGMKDVIVQINGVGSGRESALRSFVAKGLGIISISDITPVPHNGPKPPKPRRV
ncbi:MAG TPA: 30S ribosomal protein S11 [Candidatus Paceibacterota bacterium]